MFRKVFTPHALALACVGVMLLASALWLAHDRSGTERRYADFLRAHAIREDVRYAGHAFRVGESGSYDFPLPVLLLAYHKASARYAPLLAMPGVDTREFFASVEDLAAVQRRLAERQDSAEDALHIRSGLYPLALLRAFGELEEARSAFLRSGSARDAVRYTYLQRAAFKEHEDAVEAFRQNFLASVPETIGQYATNNKLVARNDVLAALDSLQGAMERTRTLWEKRISCIRGDGDACAARDLTLPPLGLSSERPTSVSGTSRELANESSRIFAASGVALDAAPLYRLSASECVQSTPQAALLYGLETIENSDGTTFVSPFYAGDVLAIATKPHAALPFFDFFAARGITYVPARPLKYYRCQESGRESGLVFALMHVREFVEQNPASEYASAPERVVLAELERHILSEVVSEEDIAAYMTRVTQPAILSGLAPEAADTALTLYLQLAYTSLGTPHVVREMVQSEEINLVLPTRGVSIDPGALYMFFARSGFVSLLLGDNGSAAGNHGPLFRENKLPYDQQPIVRLSRLPATADTVRVLVSDFAFYNRMHDFDLTAEPTQPMLPAAQ